MSAITDIFIHKNAHIHMHTQRYNERGRENERVKQAADIHREKKSCIPNLNAVQKLNKKKKRFYCQKKNHFKFLNFFFRNQSNRLVSNFSLSLCVCEFVYREYEKLNIVAAHKQATADDMYF